MSLILFKRRCHNFLPAFRGWAFSRAIMTRGNQRDKAREKNLKKQADQKKKQDGDPRKRMEAHADIMRQKQAAGRFSFCTSPVEYIKI
jgi:hypothetical protein